MCHFQETCSERISELLKIIRGWLFALHQSVLVLESLFINPINPVQNVSHLVTLL